MWQRIANHGVVDLYSLTLLGLSTSRGQQHKIGMFGSGAKHAILTLLRCGIGVEIFVGATQLTPQLEHLCTHTGEVQRLVYRVRIPGQRARVERTSCTLEFGALDWTQESMALRELISNALDGATCMGEIEIDEVEEPCGVEGWTSVFVRATSQIRRYISHKDEYFLHFAGKQTQSILTKERVSSLRFYRKGVLVDSKELLLSFNDYNDVLGRLEISESRILSDGQVLSQVGRVLSENQNALEQLLLHLNDLPASTIEVSRLSSWMISGASLRAAWRATYGEALVAYSKREAEAGQRLGYQAHVVEQFVWAEAVMQSEILAVRDMLGSVERKGLMLVTDTEKERVVNKKVNEVWYRLEQLGLTCNKLQPTVKIFQLAMDCKDRQLHGFYEANTVYLHLDSIESRKVILEELSHYLTGCGDQDRGFQDFAFRLCDLLMEGGKND